MSLIEDVWGEERTWEVVALASAAVVGLAARRALEKGWELVQHDEPPQNPAARSVSWGDALAWTAAAGVAMGLGRLIAQRGAAAGWKKIRGRYPKGLD